MAKTVPLQIEIDPELRRLFKAQCLKHDTTMAREIRRFIRQSLANPPPETRLYYQLPITDKEV